MCVCEMNKQFYQMHLFLTIKIKIIDILILKVKSKWYTEKEEIHI